MELNIFSVLIVVIMCVMGIGSSVAIIGYLLVTIAKKIYRKMRYGISLYD